MSFEKKLKQAKGKWKAAMKKKPDFGSDLPDGTYHARLTRAEVVESQSSGNLQVAWGAVVLEGEHKGEKINWYSQMQTEDNMMYLQRDITRFGEESPEDPAELEEVLSGLAKKKPAVKLSLKTNGEFQNVRIGKLLTDEDVAEEDDEEPEEEEEDEDEKEEKEEEDDSEDSEDEDSDADEEDEDDEEDEEEEDDEDEEEEEAEETVAVGMRVAFDRKGKERIGVIQKINKKDETVTVKVEGKKPFDVEVDKLRPAPKSKVTKK